MRKMDYYFRTEKLSVGYRNAPLIEDITIGLNKGEILTLIGPNGAGKSTILKSIAKQLKPMGGVVYLDEKNTGELSGKELSQKMAVVFTERLQSEMMTCEDVVATGRYPYTLLCKFRFIHNINTVDENLSLRRCNITCYHIHSS